MNRKDLFTDFRQELIDCIDDCFDTRLGCLYDALGVEDGDISPLQSLKLKTIISRFADELTEMAIELASQNMPDNGKEN